MMENLFANKTDEELKIYFKQYLEWEKTGIITNNELGEMRDAYFEKLGFSWQTICMIDLLKTIAHRWMEHS